MSCLKTCKKRQLSPQELAERKKNDEIEKGQRRGRDKMSKIMRLLLLGPGESGKSTIFKQVNTLFNKGYPEEERKKMRIIIFNNLYLGMKVLIQESEKLLLDGLETRIISDAALVAREFVEKVDYHDELTPEIAKNLDVLWKDKGIQVTWENRARFQCPYPLDFFMNKISTMVKPDYIPSQEDVLRCRVRTTGIVELEFTIEPNKFVIIDVGGQRNERRKWIRCFDGVTAVLFVAALSEYDQVLYEDQETNRLHEALDLFGQVAGSGGMEAKFTNASIILFLNKMDLFAEKIKKGIPLNKCFPDYAGSLDEKTAMNFVREKFLSKAKVPVYPHFTCATDSQLIRNVILDVREIILKKDEQQANATIN